MISSIQEPNALRKQLRGFYRTDEKSYVRYLVEKVELSADSKNRIYNIAKQVVEIPLLRVEKMQNYAC
jgi:RHH-type proline utilization regulon transcriptional repressor/proline dehydrogenase/delta 1-pyrroline-5-carboxylate dehydrogenase